MIDFNSYTDAWKRLIHSHGSYAITLFSMLETEHTHTLLYSIRFFVIFFYHKTQIELRAIILFWFFKLKNYFFQPNFHLEKAKKFQSYFYDYYLPKIFLQNLSIHSISRCEWDSYIEVVRVFNEGDYKSEQTNKMSYNSCHLIKYSVSFRSFWVKFKFKFLCFSSTWCDVAYSTARSIQFYSSQFEWKVKKVKQI